MRARVLFTTVLLMAFAGGCHKQAAEAPQPAPDATQPPAVASTAAVTANKGKAMVDAPFVDLATGGSTTLAAFKGKPVLVNLWATWCGPCVRELPALDALAAKEAGALQVIAISEDMEGAKVVTPFLAKHGIKTLHAYHDPSNGLLTALKEASLPVTVLYGADGKELWRVPGDMDWSGPKAKALLAEAGA